MDVETLIPLNVSNTILIADDEEINRAILGNIFSGHYRIEEAENGEQALRLLCQTPNRYCAVLLDVVMPVMGGLELLKELQTMGLTTSVPVFLVTSASDDSTLRRAYALGAMDVIRKPIVSYIVKRRISSVIELFQARKRLDDKVEQQQSEIIRQNRRIAELNEGMIETLATAIEFRSGETGEHVRRIRYLTELLLSNTEMGAGLLKEDIRQISLAAVMHDVGKIAIPDAILNKPGKLTPKEFHIMKSHTTEGDRLLDQIPQMRGSSMFVYARDIARHHHERWDGQGYPDGLQGEEIPTWVQVVSIADVYDALVSHRVYRGPFSPEEAMTMIENGECGKFSQKLLRCFQSVEEPIRQTYQKEQAV